MFVTLIAKDVFASAVSSSSMGSTISAESSSEPSFVVGAGCKSPSIMVVPRMAVARALRTARPEHR